MGTTANARTRGSIARWLLTDRWIIAVAVLALVGCWAAWESVLSAAEPTVTSFRTATADLDGVRFTYPGPQGATLETYAYQPDARLDLVLGLANDGPVDIVITAVRPPYTSMLGELDRTCSEWRLGESGLEVIDGDGVATDHAPVIPAGGELTLLVRGHTSPASCGFGRTAHHKADIYYAEVTYRALGRSRTLFRHGDIVVSLVSPASRLESIRDEHRDATPIGRGQRR